MQKINVILVGKNKEDFCLALSNDYQKRLQKYCNLQITEIPAQNLLNENADNIKKALFKEAKLIEKAIIKGFTVALCIEGKGLNSLEFSNIISNNQNGCINFIVGSSYGLHQSIKDAADLKISFSKMTFPHKLFRVMLLEQIYRSFNIANGTKYHK